MAVGFQPQSEAGLVDWEARLDEEVAKWKHPELPLLRYAKNFRPVPRIVTQRFLAFSNETLPLSVGFFFGDVESFGSLRKVRDEEVAEKCNRQRDDTADDEQPLFGSVEGGHRGGCQSYLPALLAVCAVKA
ncbi:hypothetical protein M3J09_007470 [Ascochyta lentis]